MADNPFDDPAVQNASGNGPPPPPQQYGDDGAYDDGGGYEENNNLNDGDNNNQNVEIDMQEQINKYVPPEQQKQIAMSAGQAVASSAMNAAADDYQTKTASQSNQHEAPPPPDACMKIFLWFPLRLFAFIGGALLIIFPILDMLVNDPTFIFGFILLYLVFFGFIIMFVEAPTFALTRWFQLKFFFWFRLLSRLWGRAWFYLFTSVLCYAGVEDSKTVSISLFAGIWLTLISLFSFIFSRMAAKKYVRIYTFIAAGAEGDALEGRFIRKFDELDMAQNGTIGSPEIVKLAEQAGRILSNAERHTIQTFLDDACNGHVTKEDWMKVWMAHNVKQKFL